MTPGLRMLKPLAGNPGRYCSPRAALTTKGRSPECAASSASSATSPVTERLIESLKRLEYRGYDSAGVAGVVGRPRSSAAAPPGKLRDLEAVLADDPLQRHASASATPAGRPTARPPSATPTRTPPAASRVVHNGIIENFAELKAELIAKGRDVRERDRHRGGRPPDRPEPGGRPAAAARRSRRRSTG